MQSSQSGSSLEARLQAYDLEVSASAEKNRCAKTVGAVCACSLAVGSVLGLAQPSLATIHYSGLKNLPVSSAATQPNVDFDGIGDPTVDVRFRHASNRIVAMGNPYGTTFTVSLAGGGAKVKKRMPDAHCFAKGDAIGAGVTSWTSSYCLMNFAATSSSSSSSSVGGDFANKTGYLGVRITATAGTYYGWIQYQGYNNGTGKIIDWAYEDTIGTRIDAGNTSSSSTPVPALDTWGILILTALLAASGVAVSRRRRARVEDAKTK